MLWRSLRSPQHFHIRSSAATALKALEPGFQPALPSLRLNSSARPSQPTAPPVKSNRLLGDGEAYSRDALQGSVTIAGLIRSVRKQKKAAFAHVSDGTTLAPLQAVLSPELAANLSNGTYVEFLGRWQDSLGKGQSHELQVEKVLAVGASNPDDNPIQKKHQTSDYLRTMPHMRIRTPFNSLLIRVRSYLIQSISSSLWGEGMVQVQPPLITSSDCEGAGEVFTIAPQASPQISNARTKNGMPEPGQQYFREPKYLTVSSQLHLEAYSAELGDVWAMSPTFRAEESDTPRHLSEFYMLEAEYRGLSDLAKLMDKVERLVRNTARDLRKHRLGQELLDFYSDTKHRGEDSFQNLGDRWNCLDGSQPWVRVTHKKAVDALKEANTAANDSLFKTAPGFTKGLQLEHERWVVEELGKGKPVFVTDYPKYVKPFYMLPSTDLSGQEHSETVACFDLLLPFGYCEVVGGSMREHRLERLVQTMRQQGMLKKRTQDQAGKEHDYPFLKADEDLGSLKWYADLRRFGSSPHGGYGLGFDRLMAYLTGVSNVRDVVAFPRTWGRADC